METIEIKCQGASVLPIDSIVEFQGNLKRLSQKNMEKLKANILKNGFCAPFFVWDNQGEYQLLDGHQRLATLIKMRQDGYDIPLLPVDFIDAENEEDAKGKLLSITSQYGEFNLDVLAGWLDQIDEDIRDTIRVVDAGMKNGSDSNKYTQKIEAPIYTPKKKKPKLSDLFDTSKYQELVAKIMLADLNEDRRNFLLMAAGRHIVFNYAKIADFYAHEDPDFKQLMEDSALVIIDYDKAIEGGFIKLIEKIEKVRQEDMGD